MVLFRYKQNDIDPMHINYALSIRLLLDSQTWGNYSFLKSLEAKVRHIRTKAPSLILDINDPRLLYGAVAARARKIDDRGR